MTEQWMFVALLVFVIFNVYSLILNLILILIIFTFYDVDVMMCTNVVDMI